MSDEQNPFPGPQPYRAADRSLFCGRDDARHALSEAIATRRMLTLYGPSGSGKSSLMLAGILPWVEERWQYRGVVVDAWPQETVRDQGPAAPIIQAFERDLALGSTVADLPAAIDLAYRRSSRPVLLLLDQLGQVLLTQGQSVLESMVETLEQLHGRRGVELHVVLTIREDYLGRWKQLLADHPRLFRDTFRLPRMTVEEMAKAVADAAAMGSPPQEWDRTRLTRLIRRMAKDGLWRSDQPEVEAAYVQIVCRSLWDEGGIEGASEQSFSRIMEHYLDSTLDRLGPLEGAARRLLENKLIARSSGTRTPVTRDQALDVLSASDDVDRILGHLEAARILRYLDDRDPPLYELGHDTLAAPIRESAERKRRAQEERQRALAQRERERKNRRRLWSLGGAVVALAVVGIGIFGLYLRAEDQARRARDAVRMAALASADTGASAVALLLDVEQPERTPGWTQAALETLESPIPFTVMANDQATFTAADISGDGRRVIAGCIAGTSWIWDVDRPIDPRVLEHDQRVRWVAFSPDDGGRLVVTAHDDGTVRLWDSDTGSAVAVLAEHGKPVRQVSFGPEGRRVATASQDGRAMIWDWEEDTKIVLEHEMAVQYVTFSPGGDLVVTASKDGNVTVWRSTDGVRRVTLAHPAIVNHVSFSPDGTRLATASMDGKTRVWNLDSALAETQQATPSPALLLDPAAYHHDACRPDDGRPSPCATWIVAFSADGRRVVTASEGGAAYVWDVEPRPEGVEAPGPLELRHGRRCGPAKEEPCAVRVAAFVPDGSAVLTGSMDYEARVWPLSEASLDETSPLDPTVLAHAALVRRVATSRDGQRILTMSMDGARIWAAGGPTEPRRFHPASGKFEAALVSPDGQWIALADQVGEVHLRRAPEWRDEVLHAHEPPRRISDTLQFVTTLVSSPDGKWLVSGARDGQALLSAVDGNDEPTRELTHDSTCGFRGNRPCAVLHADISTDGSRVATASADGSARIWAIPGGEQLARIPAGTGGSEAAERTPVLQVQFAPTDPHLLITNTATGRPTIWSVDDNGAVQLAQVPGDDVTDATFGPRAGQLAVTTEGGQVRVLKLDPGDDPAGDVSFDVVCQAEGYEECSPGSRGAEAIGTCHGVQFGPSGDQLLAERASRTPDILDADTCVPIAEIRHDQDILGVQAAFHPSGSQLVSFGEDGWARLWDAHDGHWDVASGPSIRMHHRAICDVGIGQRDCPVTDAAFLPDPEGVALLTLSEDGVARLYEAIDVAGLQDRLGAATTYCLTPEERVRLLFETPDEARVAFEGCEGARR